MHQDRLNWLSLMAIESEVLQQIEFEDIIEKFVAAKCRKVVKLYILFAQLVLLTYTIELIT